MYGASGMSKLLDPDWFGGTVTWHRVVLQRRDLAASPLPDWAVTVLADRPFHTYAAKIIVLTELFIAAGLCWRATRYAAVWVAVAFHLAIQVSARVEVFSYLAIAALVIWSVPSTRDRELRFDPSAVGQRRLVRRGRGARLAGPLPGRARGAGRGVAAHRPRREHAGGSARDPVRAEPPAPDRVVRPADAAAAHRASASRRGG